MWLGPANDQPIYRDKLHYDWHWEWNTGNGEMGNWGVHAMDDAVNVVLQDKCPFPKRVAAAGGRVVWDDAGETPNVCFAYYDTGSIPVLFGLSNLADGPDARGLKIDDVKSGYVVHCEGGYYAGGRGGGSARDPDGGLIRKFKGDAGAGHGRNFVDAVYARDRTKLNAEVQIGHQSTAWCNLGIAAQRAGPGGVPEVGRLARGGAGDVDPDRDVVLDDVHDALRVRSWRSLSAGGLATRVQRPGTGGNPVAKEKAPAPDRSAVERRCRGSDAVRTTR